MANFIPPSAKKTPVKTYFEIITEKGKQLFDSDEADMPTDLLCHRKCYQKLTNKRLIKQAVKQVSNLSDNDQSRTAEQHQPPRKSR